MFVSESTWETQTFLGKDASRRAYIDASAFYTEVLVCSLCACSGIGWVLAMPLIYNYLPQECVVMVLYETKGAFAQQMSKHWSVKTVVSTAG